MEKFKLVGIIWNLILNKLVLNIFEHCYLYSDLTLWFLAQVIYIHSTHCLCFSLPRFDIFDLVL
jgi:hypothetical protein